MSTRAFLSVLLIGLGAVSLLISPSPSASSHRIQDSASPRNGPSFPPGQMEGEGGNGNLSVIGTCPLLFQIPSNATVAGTVSDFNASENGYGGYVGASFNLNVITPSQQASVEQVILFAYGPQAPANPDADESPGRLYEGYVPHNGDSVIVSGVQWYSSPNCGGPSGPYIEATSITLNAASTTSTTNLPPSVSIASPTSNDQPYQFTNTVINLIGTATDSDGDSIVSTVWSALYSDKTVAIGSPSLNTAFTASDLCSDPNFPAGTSITIQLQATDSYGLASEAQVSITLLCQNPVGAIYSPFQLGIPKKIASAPAAARLGIQEVPNVVTNFPVAPPGGWVGYPYGVFIEPNGIFEPAVANSGSIVFYTGNTFAARSTDWGSSWTLTDPTLNVKGQGSPFFLFCCDQDVVFDPNYKVFLWYRQARPNSANENLNLLDVSKDAATWCEYQFLPKTFRPSWAGSWFDYPHLALSSSYVYLTSVRYPHSPPDPSDSERIIIRFSLKQLSSCGTLTANYFASSETGVWAPVEGASDPMYWAADKDTSTIRVYGWPESAPDWTGISHQDFIHPTYEATKKGGAHCKDLSGSDICTRIDDRVLSGWYSNPYGSADLGFVWNVKEGAGYPYPHTYVVVIRFDSSAGKWKYYATQTLWSKDEAIVYAAVAPLPSLGHVGITAFVSGPSEYPSIVLGYYGYTTGWGSYWGTEVTTGTNGIFSSKGVACTVPNGCWGDYLRVRIDSGNGVRWIATGYTMAGGTGYTPFGPAGTTRFLEPRFYVFCAPGSSGTCQGQTTAATSASTSAYTPTTQTTSNTYTRLPNYVTGPVQDLEVSSTSTISGLNYDSSKGMINFTTNGPEGTIGSTTAIFAKNLINGDPVLLIDNGVGATVNATLDSNSTHYFFSFSYFQSQHLITIEGSATFQAVPEFPSAAIVAGVAFIVVLTGISKKRRPRRRGR